MSDKTHMMVVIAGCVGLGLLSYCFYYDRKRRSDPEFRRKLIDKRKKQEKARSDKNTSKYPDLTDEVAVQAFFMKEIALGEQLMGLGDIENGIDHLANAVAVTAHKENLLNVLRTTLPDPIFKLLVERLPAVSQEIYSSYKARELSTERKAVPTTNIGPKITQIEEKEIAIDECLD